MKQILKRMPNFSVRGCKRSETNMAEEYGWSVMQAAGRSCCGGSGSSVFELGFQLDALVVEMSPYTKHYAIVVVHNSWNHLCSIWPVDQLVDRDAGQASGCASTSSVTFFGTFVE